MQAVLAFAVIKSDSIFFTLGSASRQNVCRRKGIPLLVRRELKFEYHCTPEEAKDRTHLATYGKNVSITSERHT